MSILMPDGTLQTRTPETTKLLAAITANPTGPDAQALVKRVRAQKLVSPKTDAQIIELFIQLWMLQGAPTDAD